MYVKRDITQNFVALLSASTIERVFLAVTVMIVARQVGPADFGPYAASFALTRILAVAFSLGLDTWLLRNGFREGDYSQLTKHSTSCLTIKLILGAFWLAAMLALTTFLNPEIFPPLFILLCALTVLFEEVANTVWTSAARRPSKPADCQVHHPGASSSAWRDRGLSRCGARTRQRITSSRRR